MEIRLSEKNICSCCSASQMLDLWPVFTSVVPPGSLIPVTSCCPAQSQLEAASALVSSQCCCKYAPRERPHLLTFQAQKLPQAGWNLLRKIYQVLWVLQISGELQHRHGHGSWSQERHRVTDCWRQSSAELQQVCSPSLIIPERRNWERIIPPFSTR